MPYNGDVREVFYNQDIENNKIVAGLSYLVFFLPLLIRPHSAFCRFHANQSLVLWVSITANAALRMLLIFFPAFGRILFYIIGFFLLCLMALGMFTAFRGRAKKLPVIGGVRLLS